MSKWLSLQELKSQEEFIDIAIRGMLWGNTVKKEPKYEDDLKWAKVEINDKEEMIWVNNKDLKGYKPDGYKIKQPLEQVEYGKFIRWCTTFDL